MNQPIRKAKIIEWPAILFLMCLPLFSIAQTAPEKEITNNTQSWFAFIGTVRFNQHWEMLGDFQYKANNFVGDPVFFMARGAGSYWFKENISVALGYGHLWSAPSQPDWITWGDENRIYQQFRSDWTTGKSAFGDRIRNEQRWKQKITDDKKTGDWIFTDRVRFQISYNYKLFPKKYLPSLSLADEILFQFGKEIVYNTFDQNRFFIGIKQNINPRLSFDLGYMNVFQQKSTGYQYDMNHTLRLFFYWNVGWTKEKEQVSLDLNNDE